MPPIRRVVIFPPVLRSYLTVEGGTGNVLAVAGYLHREIGTGLFHEVFPAAATLSVAATQGYYSAIPGDPEQLLKLGAGAVVTWSLFTHSLESLGVPLVQLDLSPQQTDRETKALWRLFGAVTGQRDRVEQLLCRYDREWNRVQASVSRETRHPRALFVYRVDPLVVAIGDLPESRMLSLAGADNAASSLISARITKEQLLQMAPEVVIVSKFETSGGVKAVYDDPALRSLPAVQNRRTYRQPSGDFRMDGLVDRPLMLQWLAEILYPDAMPRDFRRMLKGTYKAVYGIALSEDVIDESLHIVENRASADYSRFDRSREAPP